MEDARGCCSTMLTAGKLLAWRYGAESAVRVDMGVCWATVDAFIEGVHVGTEELAVYIIARVSVFDGVRHDSATHTSTFSLFDLSLSPSTNTSWALFEHALNANSLRFCQICSPCSRATISSSEIRAARSRAFQAASSNTLVRSKSCLRGVRRLAGASASCRRRSRRDRWRNDSSAERGVTRREGTCWLPGVWPSTAESATSCFCTQEETIN